MHIKDETPAGAARPRALDSAADMSRGDTAAGEEQWLGDARRWYQERARGVDVAKRQALRQQGARTRREG